MRIKLSNFMNSFFDKFDTPKNSKLAKISSLKFMFKKPNLSILDEFQQMKAQNLS